MSDRQQTGLVDAGPDTQPVSIGTTIVDTFNNSAARLSGQYGDDTPDTNSSQPGRGTNNDNDYVAKEMTAQMTLQTAPPSPTGPNSDLYRPEPAPRPTKPARPPAQRPRGARQSRRARLRISRVDPWSVMKTALLLGVALWIMTIVATWIIFTVLDKTGLYDAINSTVGLVFDAGNGTPFNVKDYINTTRATALSALVGAVNVILLTALATIFAFLYNLTANVMGGIEVTMAED